MTNVLADERRSVLRRRIRLLTATTITYNVIEAVIALGAGTVAGSVALIGFGLDSVIEVSSAAAVAWQFAGRDPERRERAALRVISWSFFALAAYVTIEAIRALLGAGEAERSLVGLLLVATSVVVMPFLSFAQRRAGQELGSASAVADSKQTLLCTYLSVAVLAGLALNAGFRWWWADPAAGLVLAALAAREGVKARRGDSCCTPVRMTEAPTCGCVSGCSSPCCAGGTS
jgi:divalent metal cation (Fe/Co/Zn/Cd) transporter